MFIDPERTSSTRPLSLPVFFFFVVLSIYFFFFFFSSRRRHTRSKRDWSSDVCSSDLGEPAIEARLERLRHGLRDGKRVATMLGFGPRYLHSTGQLHKGGANNGQFRSEERRVGKECRCRWWAEN